MKIDAFPHVMPRQCYDRFLASSSGVAHNFLSNLQARAPLAALWDLDARFRTMDEQGEYVQVLTLCAPPVEVVAQGQLGIDLAHLANDEMAALVGRHPDRFMGFAASLPLRDVDASLAEIDRAVNGLGALGVQIFTNVAGLPLDEPRFEPLFARMAELDRAIWVHGWRSPALADYAGETESRFGLWLGLGWPYEMSMFMARIALAGILQRYPGLRILTHHSGGMTPMFARRMGAGMGQYGAEREMAVYQALDRPVFDYARMFYADTTGQALIAIKAAIEFFGIDHVMLGTDYPWGQLPALMGVLGQLGLNAGELEQVLAGNARSVLGLNA
jgi:aminocarboxymuconate-semialdehyde decarboxylase